MIASYKICASRGRGNGWVQQLEIGGEDSTNAITSVGKDNMLLTEYTDFDELPPPCSLVSMSTLMGGGSRKSTETLDTSVH